MSRWKLKRNKYAPHDSLKSSPASLDSAKQKKGLCHKAIGAPVNRITLAKSCPDALDTMIYTSIWTRGHSPSQQRLGYWILGAMVTQNP